MKFNVHVIDKLLPQKSRCYQTKQSSNIPLFHFKHKFFKYTFFSIFNNSMEQSRFVNASIGLTSHKITPLIKSSLSTQVWAQFSWFAQSNIQLWFWYQFNMPLVTPLPLLCKWKNNLLGHLIYVNVDILSQNDVTKVRILP